MPPLFPTILTAITLNIAKAHSNFSMTSFANIIVRPRIYTCCPKSSIPRHMSARSGRWRMAEKPTNRKKKTRASAVLGRWTTSFSKFLGNFSLKTTTFYEIIPFHRSPWPYSSPEFHNENSESVARGHLSR